MRRAEEYARHGRNDPFTPDQLRDHPYDFVSLPAERATGRAVGHHTYPRERLTGELRLVYETLAPLHVGSGVFEMAEECGLGSRPVPVRGIQRRQGRPVLPGSGWKGAVRSCFEAITRSRLALVDTSGRQPSFKVPEVLRDSSRSHRIDVRDPGVTGAFAPARNVGKPEQLKDLSPAEALFGAMGYRGRVHPGDGVIEGPPSTEPLQVAPMESPARHRLAKPGAAFKEGRDTVVISAVEGRKFYYDGPIVPARHAENGRGGSYEYLDAVPSGSRVTIRVHLETLDPAELGALLISAGYGGQVGVLRFGGFKSVGLGKVALTSATVEARRGSSTASWKRRDAEALDLGELVGEALASLIDRDALAELHQVTTRQRPA